MFVVVNVDPCPGCAPAHRSRLVDSADKLVWIVAAQGIDAPHTA